MSAANVSTGRLVESIRLKLSQVEPLLRTAGETASVALILKGESGHGLQVLLIRRASRSNDPWSGQIALPGGHVESGDDSFASTAAREAFEEVGLDLASGAHFLGYMDPLEPRNQRIMVVPSVFALNGVDRVVTNQEVSSYQWVSVAALLSGRNRSQNSAARGSGARIPAFEFGDYLVWGLTERILAELAEIVSRA